MRGVRTTKTHRAFTLLELLMVVALITVLVGILLPTLNTARRTANDVKCRSNMRQIATALINYAAENRGKFPPNIDDLSLHPGRFEHWCDVDRIGRYLPSGRKSGTAGFNFRNHVIGGVMQCPADDGGSASYAMNLFASSAVKIGPRITAPNFRKAGSAWSSNAKESSKLILLIEQLSMIPDGHGDYLCIGFSPFIFSQVGNNADDLNFWPGFAFIGIPWVWAPEIQGFRHRSADTEFDWARHRRRGDGGTRYVEARGRSNIAFADGHVESFEPEDLADRNFKRSKFVALWSPLDYSVDRLPRPNF